MKVFLEELPTDIPATLGADTTAQKMIVLLSGSMVNQAPVGTTVTLLVIPHSDKQVFFFRFQSFRTFSSFAFTWTTGFQYTAFCETLT